MKRINFVLPGSGHDPVGGMKILYEYANRLTDQGYSVNVIHSPIYRKDFTFWERLKKYVRYIHRKLNNSYRPDSWFKINNSVNLLWVPTLNQKYIPDADLVVASSWETAEFVSEYDQSKGDKYYFIQHFETWSGDKDRVLNTWKLPLKKIVSAKWLEDIAYDIDEDVVRIPYGFNFDFFKITKPIEKRDDNHISMMYHILEWKGCETAIEALRIAKESNEKLTATFFSAYPSPKNLPDWINYYQNPSQQQLRDIYNNSAIFLSASVYEGWGMPGCEAMMCGCALVMTNVGGHREYAIQDETALLAFAGDSHKLANHILTLTNNRNLRIELAKNASKYVKKFTWDYAIKKFKSTTGI